MRIAIGGIVHETNTYCSEPTTLQDFSVLEGERLYRLAGTETQSGAASRRKVLLVAPQR